MAKKNIELEKKFDSISGNKNQFAVLSQCIKESSQVLRGEMVCGGGIGELKPRTESKRMDEELVTKLDVVTTGIQSCLTVLGSKEKLMNLENPSQLLQLVSWFDQLSDVVSAIRLYQHASVAEAMKHDEQIDNEIDLEVLRPRQMLEAFGELSVEFYFQCLEGLKRWFAVKDLKELEASLGPNKSELKQLLQLVRGDTEKTLSAERCESFPINY
ncbi:MAG: hypothetical protein IPF72_19570 [Chitinophagaceae bacterium]|nr:hypothetical protein [Chitinophagaceae bacterium]